MDYHEIKTLPLLTIKPSAIYALLKVLPLILMTLAFLFIAYWLYPAFLGLSLLIMLIVCYKYLKIRNTCYLISEEVIRISTGVFSTRLESLEMYRIKDYLVTQPLILRIFNLMNLTLKTTDPENKSIQFTGIPVSDLIDTIRDHVQKARLRNRIVELN